MCNMKCICNMQYEILKGQCPSIFFIFFTKLPSFLYKITVQLKVSAQVSFLCAITIFHTTLSYRWNPLSRIFTCGRHCVIRVSAVAQQHSYHIRAVGMICNMNSQTFFFRELYEIFLHCPPSRKAQL